MLVSITKFYNAVTGKTTANRTVTEAALQRWGVPYNAPNGAKGDAVDITHLEPAKRLWEAEKAAQEVAREARTSRQRRGPPPTVENTEATVANTAALAATTDAIKDLMAAAMTLAEQMVILTRAVNAKHRAGQ